MICELPSFVLFAGSGRFSVSSNQHILMKYKHICLVKGLICGYATGPFDSHSNWIWTYLWCFSSQFLFKLNDCVFSDQKAGGIFTFPACVVFICSLHGTVCPICAFLFRWCTLHSTEAWDHWPRWFRDGRPPWTGNKPATFQKPAYTVWYTVISRRNTDLILQTWYLAWCLFVVVVNLAHLQVNMQHFFYF